MRFLGFPLIPLMQIGRTRSALQWLAGRPWAAGGHGGQGGRHPARRRVTGHGDGCPGPGGHVAEGLAGLGGSAAPALALLGCSGMFSSVEKDVLLRRGKRYPGSGEPAGDPVGYCFPRLCQEGAATSEQEAVQPRGMVVHGAAGGKEQVPLPGVCVPAGRPPPVTSRTAPRAGRPRLPEQLQLSLPPARTQHRSVHPSFPCPQDGQPTPLTYLLLVARRASCGPQ